MTRSLTNLTNNSGNKIPPYGTPLLILPLVSYELNEAYRF